MRKADLTSRAVAGFVDLLIIIGLARLPDVIGFLTVSGYLLIRDGLFDRRSIGKKLIGLRVVSSENRIPAATYRESIIRNVPLVVAYLFFLIPYAGWALGPLALGIECLVAIGDEQGMRVGDMLARTYVAADTPGTAETSPNPEPPTSSASSEEGGPGAGDVMVSRGNKIDSQG